MQLHKRHAWPLLLLSLALVYCWRAAGAWDSAAGAGPAQQEGKGLSWQAATTSASASGGGSSAAGPVPPALEAAMSEGGAGSGSDEVEEAEEAEEGAVEGAEQGAVENNASGLLAVQPPLTAAEDGVPRCARCGAPLDDRGAKLQQYQHPLTRQWICKSCMSVEMGQTSIVNGPYPLQEWVADQPERERLRRQKEQAAKTAFRPDFLTGTHRRQRAAAEEEGATGAAAGGDGGGIEVAPDDEGGEKVLVYTEDGFALVVMEVMNTQVRPWLICCGWRSKVCLGWRPALGRERRHAGSF